MPQLFVASGATTWGRDAAKYPWTIGFQPSYAAEGLVYGQYIARARKKARVAVLFQNDDYGKDLLASLKLGLGRSGSKVVAAEPYEVRSSDVGSQVAKLKASRANVFCIFATPTFAIQAYVFANRLGWKPLVINNAVSGTSNIMVLASEGGKNKLVEGSITTTVLKDPTDPRWNKDPGMKQYRALLAKYAKGANPNDVYHVYGMAVAYETVGLFRRLGANPTRAALMSRARSISSAKNPFLLPGVLVKTGKGDTSRSSRASSSAGRMVASCRSAASGPRSATRRRAGRIRHRFDCGTRQGTSDERDPSASTYCSLVRSGE